MTNERMAQIVETLCFRFVTDPDTLITHNQELGALTSVLDNEGNINKLARGLVDNELLGSMMDFLDTNELLLEKALDTENPSKIIPVYLSLGNYCVIPHAYEAVVRNTDNAILHGQITLQIIKDYLDEIENEYVGVRP